MFKYNKIFIYILNRAYYLLPHRKCIKVNKMWLRQHFPPLIGVITLGYHIPTGYTNVYMHKKLITIVFKH